MQYRTLRIISIFIIGIIVLFVTLFTRQTLKGIAGADTPVSNLIVYDDQLQSGFANWSWGSSVNLANTSPIEQGTKSVNFTPSAWGAFYVHTDSAITVANYQTLHFFAQPTQSGQNLRLVFYDANNQQIATSLPLSKYIATPIVNAWNDYTIPASDIAALTTQIKGIALQDASGTPHGAIYLDDIQFTVKSATPSTASYTIYQDALGSGFMNWSWNSTADFANTTSIYQGSNAIAYTVNAGWGGLYLHNETAVSTAPYKTISFAIKASQPGERFAVSLYDASNQLTHTPLPLDTYGGQPNTTQWTTYVIPLSDLQASNRDIKGFAINDLTGHAQPVIYIDSIVLNGISTTTSQLPTTNPSAITTAMPTTQPTPTIATAQVAGSSAGYTVNNGTIFKNGNAIVLHGVSWFGAETASHVPHGLWARNWKDMITQIKASGFNAVRLPFCPQTLQNVPITGIDSSKNVDLVNLKSMDIFDKIVTELNNQQMYVLLDHHTIDCNTIPELWYSSSYSESQWINDLASLASRYKNLPYFMGIDIKNEPHGAATWGTGNANTDWNIAADKAGQQISAQNPNILIFVQGVADNPTCSDNSVAHWQGGNFEPMNCASLTKIPSNKLVFSPHVYGPDVYNQSYFSAANFPQNMPTIWEKHFGFLTNKGLTVVPGEWGGKFMDDGGSAKDPMLQSALMQYFASKHICNSFYWDWNPNSGDTGGVLQSDWTNVWQNKIDAVKAYYATCH